MLLFNVLIRRLPAPKHGFYPHHLLITQSFSTQNAIKQKSKSVSKSKQKYSSSLYGKNGKSTKSNTKKSDKSSISASDYDKESHPTGWNATFHKCHALLEYSPFGTKSMMHSFNTLVTAYVCYSM